jgi:predicted subunit of tRNA(5-methylaminomethyl-2-thiouridylate) methyltransferase
MKRIIRLTESDLTRIVKRIVNENESKLSGDFESEMRKLLNDFEDKGMSLEQMHKQLKTWEQSLSAKIHRKNKK